MTYGLKEYKELLEKQLKITVLDAPVDLSYQEVYAWCIGVHSTALYALEMLPYSDEDEINETLSSLKGWANK